MAKSSWAVQAYPFLSSKYDNKTLRKLAQYETERQWQDVFNRLVSMIVNRFEWGGDFPETCDAYFFETMLLFRGKACIIEAQPNVFLTLPCVPASSMNLYYEHNYWRAYSLGYTEKFLAVTHYNKDILTVLDKNKQAASIKGCVCFDNVQEYSMIDTVEIYTTKIVDAMRTIDVLLKQLKLSKIIETDENSKVAVQTAIRDIDANIVAVYASNSLAKALRESNRIDLGSAPGALVEAWNHLNNLYSQFYTAFGINNLNTSDKKERLLTGEINSNNEAIAQNGYYPLDQRKHFCENFKAAFGKTITCDFKHTEGGVTDGTVYNDPSGSDGSDERETV